MASDVDRGIQFDEVVLMQVLPAVAPRSSLQDHEFVFHVPYSIPQQCYGSIVKCAYLVQIKAKLSSNKKPVICSIPVLIQGSPGVENPIDPVNNDTLELLTMQVNEVIHPAPPPSLSIYPEYLQIINER
jgi:hypothetical protein